MSSISVWAAMLLAALACLANASGGFEIGGDEDTYSVVIEARCGGSYVEIYQLSWADDAKASEQPDFRLEPPEFVPAPENVYTDKAALFTYLDGLVEIVRGLVAETDNHNATRYNNAMLQFLISEDLFTLGDPHMYKWYKWVVEYFSDEANNPFYFQWDWVRIATGEEIGVNWWLLINSLRSDDYFKKYLPASESYGVIGQSRGSSIISFVPSGASFGGRYPIKVNGGGYSLHSTSNHGYGLDYINYVILYWLAQASPSSDEISSPCLLNGDKYDITILDRTLTVTGTGDYVDCSHKMDFLFERLRNGFDTFIISGYGSPSGAAPGVEPEVDSETIHFSGGVGGSIPGGFGTFSKDFSIKVGGKRVPAPGDVKFYAMGDFDEAFHELGVVGPDGKVDLNSLKTKTEGFASKTFRELLDVHPSVEPKTLSQIYQLGIYLPKMMEAYGFPSEGANIYSLRLANGEPSGKFNKDKFDNIPMGPGSGSGWSTGAMLANVPTRENCTCGN